MKTPARSFAGGEITPELYGRLDLNKRQTGLRLAENFDVLPHGPVARRSGFEFAAECRRSDVVPRLIPFEFSVDQALVIELGREYINFHTPEGTVLEANKTIASVTEAYPAVFEITAHGWLVGDWIFLLGMTGITSFNGAFFRVVTTPTADTLTLARPDGTVLNTTATGAYTGGGAAARTYTLTTPYSHEDLFDIHYTQSNDVLTLVHPSYPAAELRRLSATSWTYTPISFAPTLSPPTGVAIVATVAVATNLTEHNYLVTSVAADGVTESLFSLTVGDLNNLTLAGNYNTISWNAVAGALRYRVYKYRGGTYGYIGQTTALTLVDNNVEADTTLTPPEDIITLNTAANEYPSAVTYHEQRRWFGGTNNKPQGVWATRSGTESNLTSSVPSQDADGMAFRVASRQQNRIRHMLPLADLAVFTNAAEWRLFADNAPAITPSTFTTKTAGASGASNVQPVVTSGSLLYVQAQGAYLRELAFGGAESNYNYRTIDLSVMAPHLFDGYSLVDLAYSRAPDQRAWAVRSDGVLLGMTYVPEQQVYAWHRHTTDGLFKSVAVIPSAAEDTLYAVVQRNIDGRTVNYIERRRRRLLPSDALTAAFFADAGQTYTGSPATTISNLWHLEGEEVAVLADGAVEPRRTVANGQITLDAAATVVTVGLPYRSRLRLLPLSLEGAEAGGQGTLKTVNEVILRVSDTSTVQVGLDFDTLRAVRCRSVTDPYDSPPARVTGEVAVSVDSNWDYEGSVCVEQADPLPCTVSSLVLDVELGG